jgi:hypothetical protein
MILNSLEAPSIPDWHQEHGAVLHILFTLLSLAVLVNGMYFWLQKSQVVPSSTYLEYRQEVARAANDSSMEQPKLELEGFYAVPGGWIATKLVKDIFILVFAITSILYLARSGIHLSPPLVIPVTLGMIFVYAFFQSVLYHDWWIAIAGLRPVAYVAAGLLGIWAARQRSLEILSHYLVAVLVIELMLVLYEFFNGIPLFSTARLSNRVTGTLSFPNSLGIFAITACAFAYSFSDINRKLLLLLAVAFTYLSGSATAIVLLAVGFAMWLVQLAPRALKSWVRIAALVALAAMFVALPQLVARHDALDSLWGRIEPATDYIQNRPDAVQVLFGKGLGIGSNIVNSAVTHSEAVAEPESIDLFHARTDSTPMALINQVGIMGTVLFYLTLCIAAWIDRRALPIYAVLVLAGMTTNLLELFPVNFLLGLLLCRSYLLGRETQALKKLR